MKKVLAVTILFLIVGSLFGQPYGNEWVNSNQAYYKFKIKEEGIYTITKDQLNGAGFPVSTVPASRIRLYRRGKELAIRVNSNVGSLESIDFYGKPNDGAEDLSLYANESNQLHPDFSLFADSASYFLTYSLNNATGLRMEAYSEANSEGISAETFYTKTETAFFDEVYSSGRRYSGGDIILSSYDRGEGWTSAPVRSNVNKDVEFTISNAVQSEGSLKLFMAISGGNNNPHNVRVSVGADAGSLREVSNLTFTGFDYKDLSLELPWTDIGSDGKLIIRFTPTLQNDIIAVSTIKVEYPKAFNLSPDVDAVLALRPNGGGKSFLRVSGVGAESELIDITSDDEPIIIGVNKSSDSFIGIVRNTDIERKLLVSNTKKNISGIEEVNLPDISAAEYNYLIITHSDLRKGGDEVARYADYRTSASGGAYNVLITEIDDLFDLFSFGDPSPLAIRRFSEFMIDNGNPEYMFIIGKGLTPTSGFYKQASTDVVNFVPTFGHPGTDVPFTAGLGGNGFESSLPTGRISAFNSADIKAYLDKVIEMESTPFDDFWRKRSLLLSGGQTEREQTNFRGFIEQFEDVLSGTFLGGTSELFSKQKSESVTFISINDQINNGVSLVTFFGHSSTSTSDIEVGFVSDPELGYRNKGRYPIFLVNGCNAGNFYFDQTNETKKIFGDDWVLTPDLGAVGFIASSHFAFSSNLKRFSDLFFEFGYSDTELFGEGIGKIMQSAGKEFITRYGTSNSSVSQVQQFSLNGDPAVSLFGAKKADYDLNEEDVSFQPFEGDLIVATTDSFNIQISLKNFGRLVDDPVKVVVLRTLQDGTVINYDPVEYPKVNSQDTLNFKIRRNPEIDESGTSLFEIFVDPLNETEELNEDNNSVAVNLDVYSGSTTNLYPLNFGISPSTDVDLVFQLSNLVSDEKSVLIEIDTSASFGSSWKKGNVIATNLLGKWSVDLDFSGINDGMVFYWRTKLEKPAPNENDQWVTTSFTYKEGSPEGWRQSSAAQLQSSIQEGVFLTNGKQWQFEKESSSISVETYGADNPNLVKEDVKVLINGANQLIQSIEPTPRFPACGLNTFNAVVFDRRSAFPYLPIIFFGDDTEQRLVCGRRPQLIYTFIERDITGIDPAGAPVKTVLDSLINKSALGDVILFFNIGNVNYSKWPDKILSKMEEVGVAVAAIRDLEDGQPVVIIGKKGSAPGTAIILNNNGTSEPSLEQVIKLVTEIEGSSGEGVVQSVQIGPATNWLSFNQDIDLTNSEDEISTNIYGVESGVRTLITEGFQGTQLDLSGTNANSFNYLELEWSLSDQARQTPAQLDSWEVLFETLPDGLLLDKNKTEIVQEGLVYQPEFGFYNYTEVAFTDSLEVSYSVFNRTSRNFILDTLKIAPPKVNDTIFFSPKISTTNFIGINDVSVTVNLNNIPEQYRNNNLINRNSLLIVQPDEVNPILDVTIDGRYIRNGDFVSSNPVIDMKLRDDNKLFLKTDTLGVLLNFKSACEGCDFERVFFSDEEVAWKPATNETDFEVVYKPKNLPAGSYGFNVLAEDASGNQTGADPYEISFTIVLDPSISNFIAFPNPFREGVRFSFVLTGEEPPEELNINIYSMTGQLLRTITKEELGDLNIGQNSTDMVWDGTDSQGKYVGNGIYFYKVQLLRDGDLVDGRFFENGTGRLYLLR